MSRQFVENSVTKSYRRCVAAYITVSVSVMSKSALSDRGIPHARTGVDKGPSKSANATPISVGMIAKRPK